MIPNISKTCGKEKMIRLSFQTIEKKTKHSNIIHSDIYDLRFTLIKGDTKHFITFVDDSMKYYYVYLLKSKDEIVTKFVLYTSKVDNQLNRKIKIIKSEHGGEYVTLIGEYCTQYGVRCEVIPLCSP